MKAQFWWFSRWSLGLEWWTSSRSIPWPVSRWLLLSFPFSSRGWRAPTSWWGWGWSPSWKRKWWPSPMFTMRWRWSMRMILNTSVTYWSIVIIVIVAVAVLTRWSSFEWQSLSANTLVVGWWRWSWWSVIGTRGKLSVGLLWWW